MRCISSPPSESTYSSSCPGSPRRLPGAAGEPGTVAFRRTLGTLVWSFSSCHAEGLKENAGISHSQWILTVLSLISFSVWTLSDALRRHPITVWVAIQGLKLLEKRKDFSAQESDSICVFWAFSFSYEIIINCAWRWNMEDDATLWNWI